MKKISLKQKLYSLAAIYVTAIVTIVLLAKFGMDNLNALRAFVGAESIYVKDARKAVNSLRRYIITHNKKDYRECLKFINKINGCKNARIELEKPHPNFHAAYQYFILGGNHPADVKGMSIMLRRFQKFGPVSKAINAWKKADLLVEEIKDFNNECREEIKTGIKYKRFQKDDIDLLFKVDALDIKLMAIGTEFAKLLGEVARWSGKIFLWLMFLGAFIVTLVGILIIHFFTDNLMKRINALILASQKIGAGDLSVRCDIEAGDEISTLASSFNKMAEELKDAEDRLVRQEKLAVLGKLSGAVGHELRNPLGAIKNAVYFLRMRLNDMLSDEKIREHFNILDEEINVSNRIITDILTFGRAKEPRLSKFDIRNIIEGALARVKIPENIKLTIEFQKDLPMILADGDQLKQVFSNIIFNAVQAMPNGGLLIIKIKVFIAEDKTHWMEIAFKDTGVGISKEDLNKIFEPLFSTKIQGTGLGLTVCENLVTLHKGRIEVESKIGEGARFIVKLPIYK